MSEKRGEKEVVKRSVSINAMLNTVKSILKILFPLISFPYVSRVLQTENLGKVNYSHSVVQYFVLFAALGISTYSVREGSKLRDDKSKLQGFCNQVYTVNFIMLIISFLLMAIIIFVMPAFEGYRQLILLHSLVIVFEWIGVEWINSIYEDYLYLTVRSVLTHCLSLVALFLFVHKQEDYYIYAGISVSISAIVAISNYFYCRKHYLRPKLTLYPHFSTHLKPMLLLFANNMAVSIYTNADTTMLGYMAGDYYVGIYSVAVKIYSILKTILASIMLVSIPRLSYYLGKGMTDEYKKLTTDISSVISLIGIPAIAGVVVLAKPVVLLLAGAEYIEAEISVQILACGILFSVYEYIVSNCILIPNRKEKVLLYITMIAAGTNILFNLILIPRFTYVGTSVTTLLAEITVLVLGIIACKGLDRYIEIKTVASSVLQAVVGSVFIFLTGVIVNREFESIILQILITFFISVFGYCLILLIFKNTFLLTFLKWAIKKVRIHT